MTKEELEKEAYDYADKYWGASPCVIRALKETYINSAEPREKRIEELEAQIEKMKCCVNCKHSRTEYEHCKTDKHEKWEIKEK